ncbi:NF-kappa-B-repressing factor [Bombus vancouverensis nearcticus]|uniref:NF-kappa-B-repressing factor n=1 Tax=Bombus vancouverensis nearcticus TaxID=2705178 RepID=UPI00143B84FB|nr:NF-kappa-B-repressing factor [Bombus vancouverensis nearcticus]
MKMSGEDDWDVERYKTEHECDEHWELRRKFLLAHKNKFPEDELVCLAQVFTNVELLGCRYPKETMQLIAELAQDIVGEYREKRKIKLQRKVVEASDAASSKVKGRIASTTSSNTTKTSAQLQNTKLSHNLSSNKVPVKRRRLEEAPFGDIVIIERVGDIPQNILTNAVSVSGGNLEWKFDKIKDSYKCNIFINSKLLAEGCSSNQKSAKKEASIFGLHELQKYYYTIKIKHNINRNANVTATTMTTLKDDAISDDNIGRKLMKLMGWTGGGLGKSQQGIVEPVMIQQQMSRKGLGLKQNSCSAKDLRNKCKDIMRKYLSGDMRNDLVFSVDFTSDERAIIHQIARQLGLKSHSYGPKNERTLIVSRKIDPQDLVEELKNFGGNTNKYQLIEPTGL